MIDSKIFHHFDDGIVDDFPGVESYGEFHVRTACIVEQLEMENIGQKQSQHYCHPEMLPEHKSFFYFIISAVKLKIFKMCADKSNF